MSTKRCTLCGVVQSLTEFVRKAQSADGLDSWCKACKSERNRAWYAANRERVKERTRAWAKANRRRKAEADRAWRTANRERRKETQRAWLEANPEYSAKVAAIYRDKHPARVAARRAVGNAIQSGKLAPARDLACVRCGAPAAHYHHNNGYAPEHQLDVMAVCAPCHWALHAEAD